MSDEDKGNGDKKSLWKTAKEKFEANEKVQKMKEKVNDPEFRQEIKDKGKRGGEYISQKWTEKKEIAMEKLDQQMGDKSAKEIYDEMKETGKDKMQGISSKYSKQVRLYSVFGLSFSALLITRRVTPSIFTLGLSTYFICPEIVTDLFKQK